MDRFVKSSRRILASRNEGGQFSILDALLFIIIILCASTVLYYAVINASTEFELVSDTSLSERTELTLSVILRTTIIDEATLNHKPISEMLSEVLYLQSIGHEYATAQPEADIKEILTGLTGPDLGFVFTASSGEHSIEILSMDRGSEIHTANSNYDIVIDDQLVTIDFALGLWRL